MGGAADRRGGRAPRVVLEGITRRFGNTLANAGVDLRLEPASIHALVGENGAGKSTLMRILYGLLQPDGGRILIDECPVELPSPAAARHHGIGMIHQHFMLVPPMTVLENIVLGYPGLRGISPLKRAEAAGELRRLCAAYEFALDPGARVESLDIGQRQRVEIARLLFHGARLLICDEPTAVLAPPEVESLFRTLRRFRDEGRTVVFITHKLAEVMEIADRVTVLRRGRVIGELARDDFDRGRLVEWIIGEEAPADALGQGGAGLSGSAGPLGAEAQVAVAARDLEVAGEGGRPALEGVSFTLRRGEILGVAGVQGNGQRELAEVIAGRRAFCAGTLSIGGVNLEAGERMPAALQPAFIPEDRTSEGLIGGLPLWENLLLGHLREAPFAGRCWYGHGAVKRWARPVLERFRVRPADPDAAAEALSGGNQQKLLCARELSRASRILVAAQPTRGIDLASTAFLHDLLRALRREGGSVVLISADLDEILNLSDRIAVLYRGRLTPPEPRAAVDLTRLGRAMMGVAARASG